MVDVLIHAPKDKLRKNKPIDLVNLVIPTLLLCE